MNIGRQFAVVEESASPWLNALALPIRFSGSLNEPFVNAFGVSRREIGDRNWQT